MKVARDDVNVVVKLLIYGYIIAAKAANKLSAL